jgi:hypothetical protein
VPVGKKEEEAFDFNAATVFKQALEPLRAEVGKTLDEFVDFMKTFVFRQFV